MIRQVELIYGRIVFFSLLFFFYKALNAQEASSVADVTDQVKQALSNITEGLCHPLKSRMEHVISTEAPATVLYSVTTLVRFYRAITEQVIPDSVLDQTLSDLLALSEKSFLSRLQRETRIALGERAEPPGSDLVPAPSVSRLLSLLNEILSVASIAEDRERDMLQVCLPEMHEKHNYL